MENGDSNGKELPYWNTDSTSRCSSSVGNSSVKYSNSNHRDSNS